MMCAALLGLFGRKRLPPELLEDQTTLAVGLVASLFLVVTSLVLGLMLGAGRSDLAANDANIQRLATEVILLDRTMRAIGPETDEARRHLLEYVNQTLREGNIMEDDPQAAAALDATGASLRVIRLSDRQQIELWNNARELYRQVIREHWLPASGATIPVALIVILIFWLSVIFASFGYRAPPNAVVMASFLLAAFLISASLYLILDMDSLSSGLFRTSNLPFQRALAELRR
jgi:hypothetical protein